MDRMCKDLHNISQNIAIKTYVCFHIMARLISRSYAEHLLIIYSATHGKQEVTSYDILKESLHGKSSNLSKYMKTHFLSRKREFVPTIEINPSLFLRE